MLVDILWERGDKLKNQPPYLEAGALSYENDRFLYAVRARRTRVTRLTLGNSS